MRNFIHSAGFLIFTLLLISCSKMKPIQPISSGPFGTMPDGKQVTQYTLTNKQGMEMKVITYGGIITSLTAPDKNGTYEDIVLGYDHLEGYLKANPYFGAIIGRYGNRIAKGKFTLDSVEYTLAVNNIGNHLHGGLLGYDKVVWDAEPFENETGVGLKLSYLSPDMEEGYPGNLSATVTYTLGNDNTLQFDYQASTDKKTVINMTQHSYFNLSAMKEDVLGHDLLINADEMLPVDSTLIPTGEFRPVGGTPFDFTEAKQVGEDLAVADEQLKIAGGFDHCWILNKGSEKMNFVATLSEAKSGRKLDIYTTEPGVQFYSGNFLDGSITGKNGVVYKHRSGLCLETQHFPDSPNQSAFPTTVLSPGEAYGSSTKLVFSVLN